MHIYMGITIQDLLIALAFIIIILCLFKIRKLKKTIAQEIKRQLLPQLILEMDKKEICFYIRNEGFSIVRDIQIADTEITLDDSGFAVHFILRFKNKQLLRAKESAKLEFKVFDKEGSFLPEVTERVFFHLTNAPLKVEMTCFDIEGNYVRFMFFKKGDQFYSERIQAHP